MAVKVDTAGGVRGLHAIGLESEWFRVTVLPEVGGKIYDLVWRPTGRNYLWHNPRIAPQRYPIEGNFDNYWCGGWDDGFPTCEECVFEGERFPNLGELRSLHWTSTFAGVREGDAVAKLVAFGPITPVRAEKTIIVSGRSPVVHMRYKLVNIGPVPFHFIWGTHPALAPTAQMKLRIPAKTGIVGLSSDPKLGIAGERYAWPILESPQGRTDMSLTQGIDARTFCGHYTTDLDAGWYAVEDVETGSGFLLKFPQDLCPYLWMWLVYGGWRGYHHVIVEPWTSYPVSLTEAVKEQTSRKLEPGAKFEIEVRAAIYDKPQTWQDTLNLVL